MLILQKKLRIRIDLRKRKIYNTYVNVRKEIKMNQYLLDAKIKSKGFSLKEYPKRLNMDYSTFYRKKIGISEFDRDEIQFMKYDLDLSTEELDDIFFKD